MYEIKMHEFINKPCMRSRCMSLLPRTTLHSDSEHLYLYRWMSGKWGRKREDTRTKRSATVQTRRQKQKILGPEKSAKSLKGFQLGMPKRKDIKKCTSISANIWTSEPFSKLGIFRARNILGKGYSKLQTFWATDSFSVLGYRQFELRIFWAKNILRKRFSHVRT